MSVIRQLHYHFDAKTKLFQSNNVTTHSIGVVFLGPVTCVDVYVCLACAIYLCCIYLTLHLYQVRPDNLLLLAAQMLN